MGKLSFKPRQSGFRGHAPNHYTNCLIREKREVQPHIETREILPWTPESQQQSLGKSSGLLSASLLAWNTLMIRNAWNTVVWLSGGENTRVGGSGQPAWLCLRLPASYTLLEQCLAPCLWLIRGSFMMWQSLAFRKQAQNKAGQSHGKELLCRQPERPRLGWQVASCSLLLIPILTWWFCPGLSLLISGLLSRL